MSLLFDGVDNFVQINSSSTINDVTSKTCGAWIFARTWGEAGGRIMDKRAGGNSDGWFFALNSSNRSLRLGQDFSTTDGAWNSALDSLNTGGWHLVAFKYTRGNTSNIPTFYIDGSAQTTTIATQPVGSTLSDAQERLLLGANTFGTISFDGEITNAFHYNILLSDDDMKRMYSFTKDAPLQISPGNLVMFLPLDEFSDGTLASGANSMLDRSGNENHASVVAAGTAPSGKAEEALSYP